MGINGRKHPKGEAWGKKIDGGGKGKSGCLPAIAVPVAALLTYLVAAKTTG